MRYRVPLPRGGEAAAAASESASTDENIFYRPGAPSPSFAEEAVDWELDEQCDDHDEGTPNQHLQTHNSDRRSSSRIQRKFRRQCDRVPLLQNKPLSAFSDESNVDEEILRFATKVSDDLRDDDEEKRPPQGEARTQGQESSSYSYTYSDDESSSYTVGSQDAAKGKRSRPPSPPEGGEGGQDQPLQRYHYYWADRRTTQDRQSSPPHRLYLRPSSPGSPQQRQENQPNGAGWSRKQGRWSRSEQPGQRGSYGMWRSDSLCKYTACGKVAGYKVFFPLFFTSGLPPPETPRTPRGGPYLPSPPAPPSDPSRAPPRMGREGVGPVIWDFVKVVWGLAVGWVMGDTCGGGGLSCWGDGQVFVGDIPAYVTSQDLHNVSDYWAQYYQIDRPLTVDFNNKRKKWESTVGTRPYSATLTFMTIKAATMWVETAKCCLYYPEGRCKVQYVHYGYENPRCDKNGRGYERRTW